MSTVPEVLLEAALLEADVQMRIVCPFCRGGSTGERCMSIVRTAEGTVKYICHRANCGLAGRSNTSAYEASGQAAQPPRLSTREVKLRPLERRERKLISEAWDMNEIECRPGQWSWDDNTDRLAMPVFGYNGLLRGLMLRSLTGEAPKVLAVKWEAGPFLSWYYANSAATRVLHRLLVVEDIPSAVKVSYIYTPFSRVCALNGTHISQEGLGELIGGGFSNNVVLALDEDASEKALVYSRELALHLGRVRVLLLHRDLKNMNEKEIRECLQNVLW